MGYCTLYDLEIRASKKTLAEIEKYVTEKYFKHYSYYGIMWLFDHKLEAKPCEWYNHEPEMRKLSSKFPDVLFTLKGAGEESWDIWKKHFKGGKMQICQAKITFEHFDEAKLE